MHVLWALTRELNSQTFIYTSVPDTQILRGTQTCGSGHLWMRSLVKDFEMYKFWHSTIYHRYKMYNTHCSGIFLEEVTFGLFF